MDEKDKEEAIGKKQKTKWIWVLYGVGGVLVTVYVLFNFEIINICGWLITC